MSPRGTFHRGLTKIVFVVFQENFRGTVTVVQLAQYV